jgi:hypothetical protein
MCEGMCLGRLVGHGGPIAFQRTRARQARKAIHVSAMYAIRIALVTGPAPGLVYCRLVSDDPLTYESFAHEILATSFLRAGEDVSIDYDPFESIGGPR